jgi:hypothetical protein
MKDLILLGTAYSVFDVDYENQNTDIWATGTAFGAQCSDIKRVDLGFEIHPIEIMALEAQKKQIDYNKFNCPIMVQDAGNPITTQLINNPVTFPLDEVRKYAGVDFFTSTFCFMLVYAAMLGYKNIHFAKILLSSSGEYFLERPGIEYWIEKLIQREGINVTFPEDCELFSGTCIYGYEQRPNIYKMKSFRRHIYDSFMNEFHNVETLTAQINKVMGALECYQLISQEKDPKKLAEMVKNSRDQMHDLAGKAKIHKERFLQYFGGLQMLDYTEDRGF